MNDDVSIVSSSIDEDCVEERDEGHAKAKAEWKRQMEGGLKDPIGMCGKLRFAP